MQIHLEMLVRGSLVYGLLVIVIILSNIYPRNICLSKTSISKYCYNNYSKKNIALISGSFELLHKCWFIRFCSFRCFYKGIQRYLIFQFKSLLDLIISPLHIYSKEIMTLLYG